MNTLDKDEIEQKLTKEYNTSPELQVRFATVYDFVKQVFCSRTKPKTVHEDPDKKTQIP